MVVSLTMSHLRLNDKAEYLHAFAPSFRKVAYFFDLFWPSKNRDLKEVDSCSESCCFFAHHSVSDPHFLGVKASFLFHSCPSSVIQSSLCYMNCFFYSYKLFSQHMHEKPTALKGI